MKKTRIKLIRLRDNGLYEVERAFRTPEWPGFVIGRGEWYLDDPNHHTTYAAYTTPFVEPEDILDYEPEQRAQWWRLRGPDQGLVVLDGQGIVLSTVSPLEGVDRTSDSIGKDITEEAMTTLAERSDQSAMARTHEDNRKGQRNDTATTFLAMGILAMALLIGLLMLPTLVERASDQFGGDETSEESKVEVAPGFEQPSSSQHFGRREDIETVLLSLEEATSSPVQTALAGHAPAILLPLEASPGSSAWWPQDAARDLVAQRHS